MSSSRRRDARVRPIERFLGEEFAGGGPFALLGLSPEACSEDLVLSALDRQIDKVADHSECDTPEADEVRLALHAAAAQLLDPIVRRHLIARWKGAPPSPAAAPAHPTAASGAAAAVLRPKPAPAVSSSERLLEADAVLTLGLYGGWNSRALRRLITLAHARGLGNEQVLRVLRNLSNRRRAMPVGASPVTPAAAGPAPLGLGNQFVPGATSVYPAVASGARALRTGHEFAGVTQTVAAREEIKAAARPLESDQISIDPMASVVRRAALFGTAGVVGLAGVLGGIYLLTRGAPAAPVPPAPAPPAATGTAPPAVQPAPVAGSAARGNAAPQDMGEPVAEVASTPGVRPPAAPAKPKARSAAIAPGDPILVLRELASVSEAAAVAPEDAAKRFDQVVPKLASVWTVLPPDRQVASTDAILEYLYRVSGTPELGMRAVDVIASGARPLGGAGLQSDQVIPAAWSSGVLVRLGRERDLPSSVKAFIDREASAALGPARPAVDQTFESGALAAMHLIPRRLTPEVRSGARPDAEIDAEAWQAFLKAAQAMPVSTEMRTRLIITGLEHLLTSGPEPNASRSVAGVVAEIVAGLPWRKEDESRRWLLRWFADPRISNADLNAVTSALTTRSAAEGVDLTMVLSTSSAEGVRADLRERYATVWSLQDAISRDELLSQWSRAARQAALESQLAADEVGELASAVLLARLNEAAAWHWRGDAKEAESILAFVREPIDEAMKPGREAPADSASAELTDGAWGERYLAARQNIKFRRELLNEIDAGGVLGPVDAEVLVTEALFGAPHEIRARAQEVVRRHSLRRSVINAVLERLHRAPRIEATSDLIEDITGQPLPAARDPQWALRARRALVERLLEVTAEESPRARIDRLGLVLRATYRSMAAQAPLTSSERESSAQPAAALSAAHVWTHWRAAADSGVPSVSAPIPLIEIERRRAGRQGQAQGQVQHFAAEQASLADVLSYLVAVEQPSRVQEVRDVMTELTSDRRRAKNIFRQMNATERAIAQLWLIRLGQGLTEQES